MFSGPIRACIAPMHLPFTTNRAAATREKTSVYEALVARLVEARKAWGYGKCRTAQRLTDRYTAMETYLPFSAPSRALSATIMHLRHNAPFLIPRPQSFASARSPTSYPHRFVTRWSEVLAAFKLPIVTTRSGSAANATH